MSLLKRSRCCWIRLGGWTHPGSATSSTTLCDLANPDGAGAARERRHGRRGVWFSPTLDGMVAVDGLLEAEAGQTVMAALEPYARAPPTPRMPAAGVSGPPMP